MRREAKHQTIWSRYCQDCLKKKEYFNYELKQTRTDSFPFSSFESQQIPSLLAAQEHGYHWKHSDADQRLKPCDGSVIAPARSFVVIRYPKAFVMIGVNTFVHESGISKRKSLTYARAVELAHRIIHT